MSNFKIGDKIVNKQDKEYKGIITKIKYIPKKGLTHGDYQILWINNNQYPCGSTSENWEIDND